MTMIHPFKQIDKTFLITFFLLVVLGLVILQTASTVESYRISGNPYHYFGRQFLGGILPGIVLFSVANSIPYTWWRRGSIVILLGALVINAAIVFFPSIGVEQYGAVRWVDLGGMSFQASELLKVGLVLYLPVLLTHLKGEEKQWPFVGVIGGIVGGAIGIVAGLQSDFSTAAVLALMSGVMILHSEMRWRWVTLFLIIGVLGGSYFLVVQDYRVERLYTFFDGSAEEKALDEDWHKRQNLISVGSGGLTGVGWNQGRQKFQYVPEPLADSIFAVYGEEAGFMGILFFMGVLFVLITRMISLANKVVDPYGQYVIVGVVTWFFVQSILNIGSTMNIVPITGIPLPFVSHGSTSLWVLFFVFGIVAQLSRYRE